MVTMSAIAYSTLGVLGEKLRCFHWEMPAISPVESTRAKKRLRIDESLTFSSIVKAVASEIPTIEQEVIGNFRN